MSSRFPRESRTENLQDSLRGSVMSLITGIVIAEKRTIVADGALAAYSAIGHNQRLNAAFHLLRARGTKLPPVTTTTGLTSRLVGRATDLICRINAGKRRLRGIIPRIRITCSACDPSSDAHAHTHTHETDERHVTSLAPRERIIH